MHLTSTKKKDSCRIHVRCSHNKTSHRNYSNLLAYNKRKPVVGNYAGFSGVKNR